eukprot:SAG22_NODE_47_length_24699_cov_13.602317_8_plen_214_part_00
MSADFVTHFSTQSAPVPLSNVARAPIVSRPRLRLRLKKALPRKLRLRVFRRPVPAWYTSFLIADWCRLTAEHSQVPCYWDLGTWLWYCVPAVLYGVPFSYELNRTLYSHTLSRVLHRQARTYSNRNSMEYSYGVRIRLYARAPRRGTCFDAHLTSLRQDRGCQPLRASRSHGPGPRGAPTGGGGACLLPWRFTRAGVGGSARSQTNAQRRMHR